MMVSRKYLIISFLILSIFGCRGKIEEKRVVIRVNNYEITEEEFEKEFKKSPLGRVDTLEAREEFLNNLIDRKLILQQAQKEGLDKERNFLKLIESFWEQSLLKIALDKKSKEIAGSVYVSDEAIEARYKEMLKEGKTDKPYEEIYSQIKWELMKEKESKMMDKWLEELRKKAKIEINYDLLKKGVR
ncbi:MAG: hypothetical protein DRP76_04600 [Candidatus Omnitrophota bacterium]|nr:MAG: hypothetical protein DRP76_04600 [Candidatus Omnitrophota bacterium]